MYRLYVDEVGNDDLTHVEDERHRYLSLTGIAIDNNHARDVCTPRMNATKTLLRHDPDHSPILHRKDIMNCRGVFGCLNDTALRGEFDESLMGLIEGLDYTVITAVIDKKGMLNQRHWTEKHPYHYLMKILVEKYVRFLERNGSTGDIMPERRRGPKDPALQRAFTSVRLVGTSFVTPERVRGRLPGKELKFRDKSDNIVGLQICDLIAHPSYVYVRKQQGHAIDLAPFGEKVVAALVGAKYDRSAGGQISGFGTKYLP